MLSLALESTMDRIVRPRKTFLQEFALNSTLFGYSLVVTFLINFLRMFYRLSRRLSSQLKGREEIKTSSLNLARLRRQKKKCVVFFCSSSGEFEQARPIIDRLEKPGDCFTHVFFFSRSGYDYARARGEKVSYSLCPVDTIWNWGWILSALRPDCSIVVRHEWWPAFLATAHAWSPVWLINAVDTAAVSGKKGAIYSAFRNLGRKWLAQFFDRIYVVDNADLDAFTKGLGRPAPITSAIGDTKYDRAVERALQHTAESTHLSELIQKILPGNHLIAGSIYREDLDILIPTFAESSSLKSEWVLVLAPHHPKPDVIAGIRQRCRAAGIESITLSSLDSAQDPLVANGRALIVDTMGQLAELYSIGDIAFVGGAMHAKIHNVLEPAAHGLALASGPFYKNSREAIRLHQSGVLTIVEDKKQLADWWVDSARHTQEVKKSIYSKVSGLCGASDRLLGALNDLLKSSAISPNSLGEGAINA